MSITAYEYLSILQARDTLPEKTRENGGFDYQKLLENVRTGNLIFMVLGAYPLNEQIGGINFEQ